MALSPVLQAIGKAQGLSRPLPRDGAEGRFVKASTVLAEAKRVMAATDLFFWIVTSTIGLGEDRGSAIVRRTYCVQHVNGDKFLHEQEWPINPSWRVSASLTNATKRALIDIFLLAPGDGSSPSPTPEPIPAPRKPERGSSPGLSCDVCGCSLENDERSRAGSVRLKVRGPMADGRTACAICYMLEDPAGHALALDCGFTRAELIDQRDSRKTGKAPGSRPCVFCSANITREDYHVVLEREATSDPIPGMRSLRAPPAIYRCSINANGARSIEINGEDLGIKPSECNDVCGACAAERKYGTRQATGASPEATAETVTPLVEAAPVTPANHTGDVRPLDVTTGATAGAAPPGSAPGIMTGAGDPGGSGHAPAPSGIAHEKTITACPFGKCGGTGKLATGEVCLCARGVAPMSKTPPPPPLPKTPEPLTTAEIASRLGSSEAVLRWTRDLMLGTPNQTFPYTDHLVSRAVAQHGREVVDVAWEKVGGKFSTSHGVRSRKMHFTKRDRISDLIRQLPLIGSASDRQAGES